MKLTNNIQVFNRDCMEAMAETPDNYYDLAIVDPPYGIETNGNAQDRFRMGKDLTLINDSKPSEEYFTELIRVSKNQIIWGYNHLSDMLPSCREFIFWYKKQPVVTFSDGELAWTSFKKTAVCFEYSFQKANLQNKGNKIHPTQKPTRLYTWLLENYAKKGQKILDTHGGSFSSAIAFHYWSKGEGSFTGYELDKDYFEAAVKRFKEYQGKYPLIGDTSNNNEQQSLF